MVCFVVFCCCYLPRASKKKTWGIIQPVGKNRQKNNRYSHTIRSIKYNFLKQTNTKTCFLFDFVVTIVYHFVSVCFPVLMSQQSRSSHKKRKSAPTSSQLVRDGESNTTNTILRSSKEVATDDEDESNMESVVDPPFNTQNNTAVTSSSSSSNQNQSKSVRTPSDEELK